MKQENLLKTKLSFTDEFNFPFIGIEHYLLTIEFYFDSEKFYYPKGKTAFIEAFNKGELPQEVYNLLAFTYCLEGNVSKVLERYITSNNSLLTDWIVEDALLTLNSLTQCLNSKV